MAWSWGVFHSAKTHEIHQPLAVGFLEANGVDAKHLKKGVRLPSPERSGTGFQSSCHVRAHEMYFPSDREALAHTWNVSSGPPGPRPL